MNKEYEESSMFYATEISNITGEPVGKLMRRSTSFLKNYYKKVLTKPEDIEFYIKINNLRNKKSLEYLSDHIKDLLRDFD